MGFWYKEKTNSAENIKDKPFVVCSLGDASVTEGEVAEAFQIAALKQLPILYLVQDNGWDISANAKETRAQNAFEYINGFHDTANSIATVASVLGGIAGWALGYFAYETVAKPILSFYGKLAEFEHLKASIDDRWILLMMITSGVAHLPPIKVVTILSGAAAIDLWLFVISCIVARGARFFALAWLLRRYGEPIRGFIEQRLGLIAGLAAAAIILLYVAVKYAL